MSGISITILVVVCILVGIGLLALDWFISRDLDRREDKDDTDDSKKSEK